MNSKISVIIPVYNVEAFLPRCMDSVLHQTYENLEIFLVDDGSPDGCGAMCDEYAKADERVRVIHKQNGGLSSARNAALDVATGDFIGFVDSDDYIHPLMFERLLKTAVEEKCEIVICGNYVEKENRIMIEEPIEDEKVFYTAKEALKTLVEDKMMKNYAWNKLYRADLFEDVRYPEGRNYEDIATTYKLFDKASKIAKIPEYLYYYQIREGSISSHKDERKWFRNCCQIIESNEERFHYFKEKGYTDLADLALAKNLPYVYEALKRTYQFNEKEKRKELQTYLFDKTDAIHGNVYISDKDKKLLPYYSNSLKWTAFRMTRPALKKIRSIRNRYNRRFHGNYDFELKPGKCIRYIIFELPCFDNLGDHAIAYAQKQIVEALIAEKKEVQLFVVDGWQTVEAVSALKKVIGPEDVIFSQGGGNFGDIYSFAQSFRKKIFHAFMNNRIILFPQTMYFSQNEIGKKDLADCVAYFSRCKALTIFARDNVSYQMMRESFPKNTVLEMKDVVSYLDESEFDAKDRSGILFCLRSDIEGNIEAAQHRALLDACQQVSSNIKVSDTCEKMDIPSCDREKILRKKWQLFGSSRLVVTDRLHGMIFSLITKTPCIVLGNNHHKVKATYNTFAKCPYLYFAETVEEAQRLIREVYEKELPAERFVPVTLADWEKVLNL